MPIACTHDGISPYRKNATTNTSAGADARIGVAIVIGNVRNAQNVKTQDVATTTDLTADNTKMRPSADASTDGS